MVTKEKKRTWMLGHVEVAGMLRHENQLQHTQWSKYWKIPVLNLAVQICCSYGVKRPNDILQKEHANKQTKLPAHVSTKRRNSDITSNTDIEHQLEEEKIKQEKTTLLMQHRFKLSLWAQQLNPLSAEPPSTTCETADEQGKIIIYNLITLCSRM